MPPGYQSAQPNATGDKTYEDEYGVHLFEPFFLTFAVDDLHSCLLVLEDVW
jgi:hypothetical protein